MRIFKFGGASVKDAMGVRNLAQIVSAERENVVVVISAFGKTTDALEQVLKYWLEGDNIYNDHLDTIYNCHSSVTEELFTHGDAARRRINASFAELTGYLQSAGKKDYDFEYDQVVSYGELWSTMIVEAYLRSQGLRSKWIDIRKLLITDARHREAGINWKVSQKAVRKAFTFSDADIYVTQGFIGATEEGQATTLGREGSDYTAAVLANMLDAVDVVVWKDVPGIMSADPDWMSSAVTLPHISYLEAVEMTSSGAKIIHPKTIKPLHNKKIPMLVKSFADHAATGTIISDEAPHGDMCPVFVRKQGQILISLMPKDLSFVMGDNLARLFHVIARNGVKVNLVQTGAVSINICADHEEPKISDVMDELKKDYTILYNDGAEMLTVRHSTPEAALRVAGTKEVLLSQKTRNTVRLVVREG
jgi:aspartate kinase